MRMRILFEYFLEVGRARAEHHFVRLDSTPIHAQADIDEIIVQPMIVQRICQMSQVVVPAQRILLCGGHCLKPGSTTLSSSPPIERQ